MAITAEGLDVVGIGRFLKDNFLAVPANQRSYAWGKYGKKWGKAPIETRQNDLADLAITAWPAQAK